MNATGLVGGGLVFVALIIVFAAGWAVGARDARVRSAELEPTSLDRQNRQLARLRQANRKTEAALEAQIKEHRRTVARLEAQIVDRESTISSLRSRLYGARTSTSMLEDQLEATIRELAKVASQRVAESKTPESSPDPMNTLTFDLGEGLEVEANLTDPHQVESR